MIPISTTIVNNAIIKFDDRIEKYSTRAKKRLDELKKKLSNKNHKDFVEKLINKLDNKNLMKLTLEEIIDFKKELGIVPSTKQPKNKKRKIKTLKDKIILALEYSDKRSEFFPEYFNEIGIKACVYCNSQYTLSIDKEIYCEFGKKTNTIKWVSKFQVDHYLSQSDYPYLSISLFNLYPTCATCNNIKSNNPVEFNLYSNNIQSSKFLFTIEDKSKTKYLNSFDNNDLQIVFYDPIKGNNINEVKSSFEDTFHISKIYNTQKDLAEELLLKALIYNKEYKQTLIDNFEKAVPQSELFNRFLVGNFTEPEDIHKRPMAKFMQDIAKDVGLV